jgi:hypothetical protein
MGMYMASRSHYLIMRSACTRAQCWRPMALPLPSFTPLMTMKSNTTTASTTLPTLSLLASSSSPSYASPFIVSSSSRRSLASSSAPQRSKPIVRHRVSPILPVPSHIVRPSYVTAPGNRPPPQVEQVYIHSAKEIAAMRRSNALAHKIRQFVEPLVQVVPLIDAISYHTHCC